MNSKNWTTHSYLDNEIWSKTSIFQRLWRILRAWQYQKQFAVAYHWESSSSKASESTVKMCLLEILEYTEDTAGCQPYTLGNELWMSSWPLWTGNHKSIQLFSKITFCTMIMKNFYVLVEHHICFHNVFYAFSKLVNPSP